jgi:hypothetical protein
MQAVEQEDTYKTVQLGCNTLGLYLLLEKVCLKQNINNAELYRTQWADLKYDPSECVYEFFNEFEQAITNINDSSTGLAEGEEAVKDYDKTFRLREALPTDIAQTVMLEAYMHTHADPEYPLYSSAKSRTVTYMTNFLSNEYDNEPNREGRAMIAQRERAADRRGQHTDAKDGDKKKRHQKPTKSGGHKKKTVLTAATFCYNCSDKNHLSTECPEEPHRCQICKKLNNKEDHCKFNPKNSDCFPDIMAEKEENSEKFGGRKRSHESEMADSAKRGTKGKKGRRTYKVALSDAPMDVIEDKDDDDDDLPGNYLNRSGSALSAGSQIEEEESGKSDSADEEEEVTLATVTQTNTTVTLAQTEVPNAAMMLQRLLMQNITPEMINTLIPTLLPMIMPMIQASNTSQQSMAVLQDSQNTLEDTADAEAAADAAEMANEIRTEQKSKSESRPAKYESKASKTAAKKRAAAEHKLQEACMQETFTQKSVPVLEGLDIWHEVKTKKHGRKHTSKDHISSGEEDARADADTEDRSGT